MRIPALTLILALALASVAQSATFTTVRIYDEQTNQTNAINSDLTSSLTAFVGRMQSAYDAGLGGVINFDLPNGSATNLNSQASFTASYGLGTVTVTSNTNGSTNSLINLSTFTSITPISGSSSTDSKGLLANDSTVNAQRLTFSDLPPGQSIQEVGLTVLSRDSKAQSYRVEFFLDGNTTTADQTFNDSILAGKANDDTFLSYAAPTGSAITSVRFTWDTAGAISADDRLAIDDLAIIVVPEPSALGLMGLAGLALLRRRHAAR